MLIAVVVTPVALRAEISTLRLGDASGAPGAIVDVPVRATFDRAISGFSIVFRFDGERMTLLEFSLDGVSFSGSDSPQTFANALVLNEGFVVLSNASDATLVEIAAGEDVLLGTIRFRIRADANPGQAPVTPMLDGLETAANTAFTYADSIGDAPLELFGASVTVTPSPGPRPVADLSCEQFLDQVRIRFRPLAAYTKIEIERDGELIATLPGDATGFEETLSQPREYVYAVKASTFDVPAIPVICELRFVPPAAPQVERFSCDDAELAWRNPVTFDAVHVFRNSRLLASLPGDATSYVDPDPLPGSPVYTIVSELQGFLSREVNCLEDDVTFEVGDVQVDVDADRIVVPILVTSSVIMKGFQVVVETDLERLRFCECPAASIQGTVSDTTPRPDIFFMGIGAFGAPSVGIAWDVFLPAAGSVRSGRFASERVQLHLSAARYLRRR